MVAGVCLANPDTLSTDLLTPVLLSSPIETLADARGRSCRVAAPATDMRTWLHSAQKWSSQVRCLRTAGTGACHSHECRRNTRQMQCLGRECSGNTRQRQCLTGRDEDLAQPGGVRFTRRRAGGAAGGVKWVHHRDARGLVKLRRRRRRCLGIATATWARAAAHPGMHGTNQIAHPCGQSGGAGEARIPGRRRQPGVIVRTDWCARGAGVAIGLGDYRGFTGPLSICLVPRGHWCAGSARGREAPEI